MGSKPSVSKNIENDDIKLYMPNYCSNYLDYYIKITTDPIVYNDNICNESHNDISQYKEGDYVTLKNSIFNNDSKIFKINKIVDGIAILLNFMAVPIDKYIFEKYLVEYLNEKNSLLTGRHKMEPSEVYSKFYPSYMTMEQILQERIVIDNIKIKNL
jgi:hypothetical protein